MSWRMAAARAAHAPLLAAALAALLASLAHAHEPLACSYVSAGHAAGVPLQLAVTYLTPGLADWTISVPVQVDSAQCSHGLVAGQEALACDYDVQPYVHVDERGDVHVHRNGYVRGYATLNVTVYCAPPPPRAIDARAPDMLPLVPPRFAPWSHPQPTAWPLARVPPDEDSASESLEEDDEEAHALRSLQLKVPQLLLLPDKLFHQFVKAVVKGAKNLLIKDNTSKPKKSRNPLRNVVNILKASDG